MIRALGGVLDTARDRVLVIDDGSPDGTGEIADRLSAELGWVSVLHRDRKEGIGPAYVAGFRQALADGAELVLEMDCDFSHDPADVPRLIAAAENGADLVLGSRYTAGGGTRNWGLGRRIVSRGGCLYAQVLLGIGIRDLTGRLQVLPPRGARGDRPRGALRARLRVPDRDDVPRPARRPSDRRGADHVRGATCGRVQDDGLDRRRGDVAGPAAPAARARRPIVTLVVFTVPGTEAAIRRRLSTVTPSPMDEVTCDVRRRGPRPVPVIVDFWAPWCRPCDAIEPHLRALAEEWDGRVRLVRVDRRRGAGLSSRYGVLSLPTVVLFAAGEPRATVLRRAVARAGLTSASRRISAGAPC